MLISTGADHATAAPVPIRFRSLLREMLLSAPSMDGSCGRMRPFRLGKTVSKPSISSGYGLSRIIHET
jgi:hypothetical protein